MPRKLDESTLEEIRKFIFDTPLYTALTPDEEWQLPAAILSVDYRIDGYCSGCGKHSTFKRSTNITPIELSNWLQTKFYRGILTFTCARADHSVSMWMYMSKTRMVKHGQHPSFADIANDDAKKYAKILGDYAPEMHKAIGLAAHGVGIGSFVYLRRVFETLVYRRFDEFKDAEGWNFDDFKKLRMNEKVAFLKGHLPEFMVKNAKIYSILSVGVHSLTEDDCLHMFEPIKSSIFFILDEDMKKAEETKAKSDLEKLIAGYTAPDVSGAEEDI